MGKVKICVPENNPISDEERQLLNELYEMWGDRIREAEMDEMVLLRFLRGYVNEEDRKATAFKTIDETLTWRKEEDVDSIAATHFENRNAFIKLWPHGMHGVSKDGHVIYIDRPGKVSPKVLDTQFSMEEYTKLHIQTMEWMNDAKIKLSQRLGTHTYKHMVIFDMEDFGFSHFSEKFRGPLKKILAIDSTRYPETLHKMFVVNASFMFKAIWAIVSPWLDEVTKSRIIFCKTKELLNHIDADQLPDFLGGTCKYTAEAPCFVAPFKSGEGSTSPYDDIFQNLLENRQQHLAEKQARAVAALSVAETSTAEGETAPTTTTEESTPAAESTDAVAEIETPATDAVADEATPVVTEVAKVEESA